MTEAPRVGQGVRVQGATKKFGATAALTEVDFTVAAGEFLVLLGPSGSGKSTLIRCLAGVERLDSGQLHVGGQLVTDGKRHLPPERRNLAMVFQDYALWPHLSVAGNVEYALRRRRLPRSESSRRVTETLERVGLGGHHDRYPHQLSGGEQQRVALARAVVAEPGLLLFDEPLSNLDADLRERLRVEISTLTRESGATAVYITHDQSEAFALADQIGVLDRGRLVQLGKPEDLYQRPATPFVARFTGTAGEFRGTVLGSSGQVADVRVGGEVVRARLMEHAPVGSPVTVHIRPEAAGLMDPSEKTSPLRGQLSGSVIDVAYRGRGYDHVVACAEGALTAVRAPLPHRRGEWVRVAIDPAHCFAFPQDHDVRDDRELTAVTLPAVGEDLGLAGQALSRRNT